MRCGPGKATGKPMPTTLHPGRMVFLKLCPVIRWHLKVATGAVTPSPKFVGASATSPASTALPAMPSATLIITATTKSLKNPYLQTISVGI